MLVGAEAANKHMAHDARIRHDDGCLDAQSGKMVTLSDSNTAERIIKDEMELCAIQKDSCCLRAMSQRIISRTTTLPIGYKSH